MRLYLDTNILIAMLTQDGEDLDRDTYELITDYINTLFTCPICVHEFIYLRQSGKISIGKEWKKDIDVVQRLSEFDVKITPITAKHLQAEEKLPLVDKHKDPLDRFIVAQAISDKAMLISSDMKFPQYEKFGLKLHLNKRRRKK